MSTQFAELGLNEQILAGVEALGFIEPTPVQEQSIPLVLEGRDLVASAQTGTGKTAAFVLPTLQLIAGLGAQDQGTAVEEGMALAEGHSEPYVEDRSGVSEENQPETPAENECGQPSEHVGAPSEDRSEMSNEDQSSASPEVQGVALSEDQPGTPAEYPLEIPAENKPSRLIEDQLGTFAEDQPGTPAKELDSAPSSDQGTELTAETTPEESSPEAEPGRPARRRRRRRRRRSSGTSEQASQEAASKTASEARPEAPTANDPAQKAPSEAAGTSDQRTRRRRRRRRGKGREAEPTRLAQPVSGPATPLALVITPTRELAQQIERVTTVVCEHTGQRSVIVMGGARFDRQLRDLQRGCDLLVATPGRLIDLMERRFVDLSHIQVLVLDEADRMLDMGFWPSVRRILQALPARRQNLLFSATIPPSIKGTIDAMLTDPATVEIARIGQTADTVEEHLMPVTQGQKTQLLQELIRTGGAEPGTTPERVLVFCRTKHRVDDVSKSLKDAGLKVEVMHADRRQEAREKALRRFREGTVQVLVATDVMSRGIDVSGIDAVVNYDVPLDPEDYVHRIGRTGRAGATGHAYTFVAPDEVSPLREIEYFTKKRVPVWDLPGFSYDAGRIVPQENRSTVKPTRTMFAGSRQRGRGPSGGRYGRHY